MRLVHYGTERFSLGLASERMCIVLVFPACGARIVFTPFLILSAHVPVPGEEIVTFSERRVDTRVKIRVPLRFRALNSPGSAEQIAESENISQRGLYFTTIFPLEVGNSVEIFLRMPQELSSKMSKIVKCVARVVRISIAAHPGGRTGVGLHIERYEATATAGERWAN